MKKIIKKNQVIVTALAILIAIAGYIKYTNTNLTKDSKTVNNEVYESVYENDSLTDKSKDIESMDEKATEEETDQPGSAVLTNTSANSSYIIQARLSREQTRSKSTEMLNNIINNENLSKSEKKKAVKSMVELTNFSETENTIETLLKAKGYENVIVTLSKNQADVIYEGALDDTKRAQIVSVIKRKTKLDSSKITITPAK